MKKFISFVMAAAMVASLVPATAFAATGDVSATAKIVGAWTKNQDAMDAVDGVVEGTNTPELQLKITNADYPQTTSKTPVQTVTVTLDNAEFADRNTLNNGISVNLASSGSNSAATTAYSYTALTAAQLKEFIIDYGYDGDTTIPSNYRKIDSYDSSSTSQQGDALSGTDLSILTAPTTTGASLADNRTTALNAYLTSLSLDSYASGYVYSDNNVLYGEAGWLNIASSTKPFVSLAEVTEYAETNNTQDSDSNNIVVGGEIVSTLVKQDVDAWYTQESAESDFQELAAKLYVETSKYVPGTGTGRTVTAEIEAGDWSDDEITITITGWLAEDDVIAIDLLSTMDKTSKNATVSVESDMVDADDLTYVAIEDTGFTASVKKTISIAEEEVAYLNSNGLKLEEIVEGSFQKGDEVTLKLSKGFEFVSTDVYVNGIAATDEEFDDNELTFTLTQAMLDAGIDSDDIVTLTIKSTSDTASTDHGLKIEATSASAGTTGTITVTVGSMDKVTVDVAEVVAYEVVMSVDEDEDVPVIYSGVDADNTGITDDSDHETLEITLEESFPGAWSSRQGFTITIPEGVYVTDVEIVDQENFWQDDATMTDADWEDAFEDAYQDGDHLNFEFDKRVFDDVNASLNDDPASLTFVLTLVADPGFEGDVEIGFEGSLVESQSVVAATFVSPYTVTAEQNDLKIDSRYTEIPTDIVITEAADGLWEKGSEFTFQIEKELISFEDDATFTADDDSEMELKTTQSAGTLTFEVKSASDEAATVTISDMELYMDRNIPTGAYALELYTTMSDAYEAQLLYAPDDSSASAGDYGDDDLDGDNFVGDITDYSNVVKDSFINVITGTTDGALFTTKIVVPVGENYLIAGDTQIELDVPAYINADGYTMLPIRAVSTALGIDNNSVLWDQASKTVTILYGQRIISMTYGQKVMYVNGQAIATSSAVEITNDRAFLPMRDLATALGITDITWDDTTKTATLNGGEA